MTNIERIFKESNAFQALVASYLIWSTDYVKDVDGRELREWLLKEAEDEQRED